MTRNYKRHNFARTMMALCVLISGGMPASAEDAVSAQDATPALAQAQAPELRAGVANQSAADLDTLTDQIVQKQLEFLKLNTNFRLNQIQKPWQGRLWFLVNLANVSLTSTGAYINGFGRFSYLHKNRIKRAPKDLFEHAGWLRVIANSETVAGALIEMGALYAKQRHDLKKNMDLPTLHRYALRAQKEMDEMLARRTSMVASANLNAEERQAAEAETVVLNDLRQLTLNEFARYYADARGGYAVNYLGYSMAALSNGTAGAGGIVGIHASQITHGTARYRTRLGGTGGITDIIAGSINQSVPFALRYSGRYMFSRTFRNMRAELSCSDPPLLSRFHEDVNRYHELTSAHPQLGVHGAVMQDGVFNRAASIFDEHEKLAAGDAGASKRRFRSQLVFFTGIGAPKLTNGIGSAVAAFKYTGNAHQRFESIGGPAIAYGAGYNVAAAELMRNQLWLELREARAKREGRSNGQVLHRELDQLQALTR